MDIYSDPYEPEIHQPKIFFTGLLIVQKIIRRLIRMVMPTEQELTKAGVYLGKMYH